MIVSSKKVFFTTQRYSPRDNIINKEAEVLLNRQSLLAPGCIVGTSLSVACVHRHQQWIGWIGQFACKMIATPMCVNSGAGVATDGRHIKPSSLKMFRLMYSVCITQ